VRSEKQQLEVENQQLRNELSGNAGQGTGPSEPVVEEKHGLFRR